MCWLCSSVIYSVDCMHMCVCFSVSFSFFKQTNEQYTRVFHAFILYANSYNFCSAHKPTQFFVYDMHAILLSCSDHLISYSTHTVWVVSVLVRAHFVKNTHSYNCMVRLIQDRCSARYVSRFSMETNIDRSSLLKYWPTYLEQRFMIIVVVVVVIINSTSLAVFVVVVFVTPNENHTLIHLCAWFVVYFCRICL